MLSVKKEYKKFSRKSYNSFILGGDVGGTNTNIGVFGAKNTPELLFSFHFRSKELKGIGEAVNYVLGQCRTAYGISINKACFGAAGQVSSKGNFVRITNLKWDISRNDLLRKTKLKKILLINDFEAIGYSVNILLKKDVVLVKKAQKIAKAPLAIIGAGTGLGKATASYNEHLKLYIPLASEGGHIDFPAQNDEEIKLAKFIKKFEKRKDVTYQEILSGSGLVNVYSFLRKNKKTDVTPELISKYRKKDATCKKTFEIFRTVYARFAKSVALDSLAFGGIYLAGGIAAKNSDIFDKDFVKEFMQSHKLRHVLEKIPIYLIMNYDAGMLGAGFAASKLIK